MKEKPERLLLRPQEAFDAIGVGRSKGYMLLASGEIPSIQIGRSIRIPIGSLQRWIEEKSKQAEMAR